jgi:CRISPR-associated protein Cas1
MGRPALALDIMEEFRPLIADSAVITAINTRVVCPSDFVRAGHSVNLSAEGRRKFFESYERRTTSLVTHPVFDYKVSYRRALELQVRMAAKVLTREIPEYVPFTTR